MEDRPVSGVAVGAEALTLPFGTVRGALTTGLLVCVAVALPVVAHRAGLPVRYLLPMHWPVLLAGLVYGWRSGTLVGAAAPGVSHLLSGYPLPHILPAMTLELATYGLVVGWLRERRGWNGVAATAVALVVGRAVFSVAVLVGVTGLGPLPAYFAAALLPGLAAAALQVGILPFAARGWVAWSRRQGRG